MPKLARLVTAPEHFTFFSALQNEEPVVNLLISLADFLGFIVHTGPSVPYPTLPPVCYIAFKLELL